MAIDTEWETVARAMQKPAKLRFDLLPAHGVTAVAQAMTIGGDKRPDGDDWRTKPVEHHVAALMRHLYARQRGEVRDPDGQLHSASIAARALMIAELEMLAQQ